MAIATKITATICPYVLGIFLFEIIENKKGDAPVPFLINLNQLN
ncbi:hypothetical protein MARI151_10450 [Maribacter litoralis]|uniref:Uncharacterized protein n=1 Tax=Maribacter litoralis TaxID=2059726 RepID=A0A653MQS3_9FLAO|nr:hypothetical protein MARI151_10450 [Maribacter litoralis]